MLQITTENKLGSNCSGTDGTPNRVLTLANSYLTVNNGFVLFLSGLTQAVNLDYTISHLNTGSQITFLGNVHDETPIQVIYFQDVPNPTLTTLAGVIPYTENLLGSNCTGADGAVNRTLALNNSKLTSGTGFMVFVGGFSMALTLDYTVSHLAADTIVTFLGAVHNESPIEVIYFLPTIPIYAGLNRRINTFIRILDKHGQTVTLRKSTTTRDGFGGITAYTNIDYPIKWYPQAITEKDRNLVDMGLAVAGDMKAFFYPYYTSTDTGIAGSSITIETGDVIIDTHSIKWRVENKLGGRIADGIEIFSPTIIKRMDLTN